MNTWQVPVVFDCAGDQLVGILHRGHEEMTTGVVIVVGGPQYRVGSHRQFVLMARSIAAAGYPVLRFDYRGMGDAEGAVRSFEDIDDDIGAAIDKLVAEAPGLKNVVVLGLCDAASATLMYAAGDLRVSGLILLNPWVRSTQGEAKSYLRRYYFQRLIQKSFWRKVFWGKYEIRRSVREFWQSIYIAMGDQEIEPAEQGGTGPFVTRMLEGIEGFRGNVLLVISGKDLTAGEFIDLCRRSTRWEREIKQPRVELLCFPTADHTLSRRKHLDAASAACERFMAELIDH